MPDQGRNFFSTSSAEVSPHLYWQASTLAHYARNPLVLRDREGNRLASLVGSQTSVNLLASLGLLERAELGLDVPLVATRAEGISPTLGSIDRGGVGLGDVRLVPKFQVLSSRDHAYDHGFALALVGDVFIPLNQAESFHGGELRGGLRLAADTVFGGGARLAANVGYMFRPETQFMTLELGDMLSWALAGEVPLGADLRVLGEIVGKVSLSPTELRLAHLPLEAIVGARYEKHGLFAQVGGGVGIIYGFGTPDFRALLGVGYTLAAPSPDHFIPRPVVEDIPAKVLPELETSAVALVPEPELEPELEPLVTSDEEPYEDPVPRATIDETRQQIVINQTIHFELNSAKVERRSFPILDKVAEILENHPEMRLRIEGHGDWRGGHYINFYLSERRARYVRIYLIEKGVAGERLEMRGMGRDHPIADNETEAGMARNRRVEFHILGKGR